MSSIIRVARSTNRNYLPAALDYGEPGYIKNEEFYVGNGDGSAFSVNNWDNIINKPNLATFLAHETIPIFTPVTIDSSSHVIVADKGTTSKARVYGFSLNAGNANASINIQTFGEITNPAWALTPGKTYFLGDAGALVDAYSGFLSTDYVSPLGIAVSATTLALNIELGFSLGVQSINGRSGSISLTPSDVSLGNVENVALSSLIKKLESTVAHSSTIDPCFTISGAQACRFDILYYTEDKTNLRFETVLVVVGASNTIQESSISSTPEIGNTSGISVNFSTTGSNIVIGFNITSGSWRFAVTAHPVVLSGSSVTYNVASGA